MIVIKNWNMLRENIGDVLNVSYYMKYRRLQEVDLHD
jgi:hypothetical protein